jgi:hypothetical protein
MVKAFLTGMREFRSDVTTHYSGGQAAAYDWGREIAHRVMRRRTTAWLVVVSFVSGALSALGAVWVGGF